MGKFVFAVMMVFIIEMALWLFGGASYSKTSLFNIILNPSTLLSNPLYAIVILGTLITFGLAAVVPIVAGTSVQFNIFALYAGISAIFITFIMSIVHLSQFVGGQLGTFVFGDIITVIIIAPFIITYILATVEWVRSNT